ncbi:MAG: hypothetical protein FJW63_04140 [Actinobacteria bacterium]|nr:hypothetical protein [Actinomycetota bacterium]
MTTTITPMERTIAAVSLRQSDRVPVLPWYAAWAAGLIGASIRQHDTDPYVMAKAQIAAYKELAQDGVITNIGAIVEPSAVGCPVSQEENREAKIEEYIINDLKDIEKLKVPDPEEDGYMPVVLNATRILHKEFKNDVPIWTSADTPWQMAMNIRGPKNMIYDTYDNPSLVYELLEFCYKVMCIWVEALIKAGAYVVLMGDAMSSLNLISPSIYRQWSWPYQLAMVRRIHSLGALCQLHICGDVTEIVYLEALTGADVICIDYQVDMNYAKNKIGSFSCLMGNVDPTGVMLMQGPDIIDEECRSIIEKAAQGGGLILSSGCDIPPGTPLENVRAMVMAAQKYGSYPIEV